MSAISGDEQDPAGYFDTFDEDHDAFDRYLYWGEDPGNDGGEDFDCGFLPGYGCQLAGTEKCDFECPFAAKLHRHPDYPNVTFVPIPPLELSLPTRQPAQALIPIRCNHDQSRPQTPRQSCPASARCRTAQHP